MRLIAHQPSRRGLPISRGTRTFNAFAGHQGNSSHPYLLVTASHDRWFILKSVVGLREDPFGSPSAQ